MEVWEQAIDALLAELLKKKFANTRPRAVATKRRVNAATRSRHIPADMKREVFSRDDGRCTFTDPSGRRCDERGFVEIHHRTAFAKGGSHEIDNLTLHCRLCRARHNLHYADSGIMPRRVG